MIHVPPKVSLSDFLQDHVDQEFAETAKTAGTASDKRVSVGDLLQRLQGRSGPALLFVFALPNVFPMPPGISILLGWPLVYLSWQLMMHRPPWLPKLILDQSVSANSFRVMIVRGVPYLRRAERLLRPRWSALTSPMATRVASAVCLGLSLILLFPIPLGNMLPALAISLFAMGLLERDGLCLAIGFIVAGISGAVIWGVLWAFLKAALLLWPL